MGFVCGGFGGLLVFEFGKFCIVFVDVGCFKLSDFKIYVNVF